jgi:glycosyltransferase involved in cell wall biosynthesis
LAGAADAIVVPSAIALGRLRELGAPVEGARVLGSVQRSFAERSSAARGEYVLAAGRLTPEKGFADVVEACERAGLPLVLAGDGPERAAFESRARCVGHVTAEKLAALRAGAAVSVVPSRYAEILPLAALESMAAGLPTVAAASGGLIEAVPEEGHYPPGDVDSLAHRLRSLWRDAAAGERALARARERWSPAVIARELDAVYSETSSHGRC